MRNASFQWADENLESKKVKKRKQKKSIQISTASMKPQRKRRVVNISRVPVMTRSEEI